MINTKYIELQEFLRVRIASSDAQRRSLALALGVAISRMIPLPTSAVIDDLSLFDTSLIHVADEHISAFNENIVVDIEEVRATARAFWLSRYQAAHGSSSLIIPRGEGGFADRLFGLSVHVSPDTIKYLNENAEVILVMINRIQGVLSAGAGQAQ